MSYHGTGGLDSYSLSAMPMHSMFADAEHEPRPVLVVFRPRSRAQRAHLVLRPNTSPVSALLMTQLRAAPMRPSG